MSPFGKKGPTEDDFETCADVLSWIISWYEKNEPSATIEINNLKNAELEIPENVAELEDRDDDEEE